MKTIFAVDLFSGAGGTSTGLAQAADALGLQVNLLAINHWQVAIATHAENHPNADHRCESLDNVDPRKAIPGGRLDILVASPECTYHSRARGGKPVNDQSRASAWHVLRWCEALDVQNVLIENVPEFQDWGPLFTDCNCGAGVDSDASLHTKKCHYLRPIPKMKGRIYRAFLSSLRALGYTVDARVINTADYGDPTTRKRLFVLARKGKRVRWPEATHSQAGADMFGVVKKWKPAREIIDWSVSGSSIFNRKKPLAENTMKRIEAGLRKYGGQAFVVGHPNSTHANVHSVDNPLQTITGTSSDMYLAQPFILQMDMGGRLQGVDEPLNTVTSADARALVQPFIVPVNHGTGDMRTYSLDAPMPTVTAFDALGLAQPFLVEYHGGQNADRRVRSLDEPLPTQDTSNRFGLAEPFIVMLNGTSDSNLKASNRAVSEPLPTVTTAKHIGLVQPFLVEYHGTGVTNDINHPLPTITWRDRFGLVEPYVFMNETGAKYLLDVRFRMLQPGELARAMSFPADYRFTGNREQVVKQIGNAVPVSTASALCRALLA